MKTPCRWKVHAIILALTVGRGGQGTARAAFRGNCSFRGKCLCLQKVWADWDRLVSLTTLSSAPEGPPLPRGVAPGSVTLGGSPLVRKAFSSQSSRQGQFLSWFHSARIRQAKVVTGKSLDSPERGNVDKMSERYPKIVRRVETHTFRTFFDNFCLFGRCFCLVALSYARPLQGKVLPYHWHQLDYTRLSTFF